ncbi:MAG: glycosyltransferase family A protein [Pseudomonadota bacterium]
MIALGTAAPRVTVGLPVFNGASLLRECLESLAAQDYDGFVVKIADNGSTDGTSEIAAEFAARDPRFVHTRRAETVPAVQNFQELCDAAETEFFAWRAYDDLSAPDFLSKSVAALDAAPQAVLAAPQIRALRMSGRKDQIRPVLAQHRTGVRGLSARLFGAHAAWIYGVWRTEAVRQTFARVMAAYQHAWGQDHLILLPHLLDDAVAMVPETTFVQRLVDDRPRVALARPDAAMMATVRAAFEQEVRARIAERQWSLPERVALSLMVPRYVSQRCHSRLRILKRRVGLG